VTSLHFSSFRGSEPVIDYKWNFYFIHCFSIFGVNGNIHFYEIRQKQSPCFNLCRESKRIENHIRRNLILGFLCFIDYPFTWLIIYLLSINITKAHVFLGGGAIKFDPRSKQRVLWVPAGSGPIWLTSFEVISSICIIHGWGHISQRDPMGTGTELQDSRPAGLSQCILSATIRPLQLDRQGHRSCSQICTATGCSAGPLWHPKVYVSRPFAENLRREILKPSGSCRVAKLWGDMLPNRQWLLVADCKSRCEHKETHRKFGEKK
jgi:hypothetical protein